MVSDSIAQRSTLAHSTPFRIFLFIFAAICIVWPALLNQQYIFFFDTYGYLNGGMQALRESVGLDIEWTVQSFASGLVDTPTSGAADGDISAARSVYYGFFLAVGAAMGSLWISIAIQSLIVALAILLTVRSFCPASGLAYPAVLIGLGLLTPLSFFNSYLMPDVFAGVTILAIAALVSFDGLPKASRWQWFFLLVLSLVVHSSHLAIAILMVTLALVIAMLPIARVPWRSLLMVVAGIAVGILSQVAFSKVVQIVYGHPPLRPPFLMARVITDGPGLAYLKETCPESGFRICDFVSVLPLGNDEFLWSKDKGAGVYGAADVRTRAELVSEQSRFVWEVLKDDPAGQLRASFGNFVEQMTRFSLHEFAYDAHMKRMIDKHLPAAVSRGFHASLLYRDTFPLDAASQVFQAVVLLSGLVLAGWTALRLHAAKQGYPQHNWPAQIFVLMVVGGIVANAAVTGILSTPHDRYQARVIWLVPMLVMLLFVLKKSENNLRIGEKT
jgi:hypothetical protein